MAGLGFGWAMTGLATVVQERAPEELRGRIMALWLVGFVGSRPIAAILLGGTADLLSVQAAFAVAAALSAVVVAAVPPVAVGRALAGSAARRVRRRCRTASRTHDGRVSSPRRPRGRQRLGSRRCRGGQHFVGLVRRLR